MGRAPLLARRKTLVWGGVLLAALFLLAAPFLPLAFAVGRAAWDEWNRCRGFTRFDARVWRDAGDEVRAKALPYGVRTCMVDDLIGGKSLVSQPRPVVLALLGKPNPPADASTGDLTYWLGPERGFISIDSERLTIEFDDLNIVRSVHVWTD